MGHSTHSHPFPLSILPQPVPTLWSISKGPEIWLQQRCFPGMTFYTVLWVGDYVFVWKQPAWNIEPCFKTELMKKKRRQQCASQERTHRTRHKHWALFLILKCTRAVTRCNFPYSDTHSISDWPFSFSATQNEIILIMLQITLLSNTWDWIWYWPETIILRLCKWINNNRVSGCLCFITQ